MLNIHSASDPIEIKTVTILVYGDPGAGKTSLAFTAEDPLLIDFDRGAHRSQFRGDSVQVESWADVAQMGETDLKPYKTICVDTVGRCLDMMSLDIMASDPKMKTPAGALTLQGWGILKSRFAAWMRLVRSFGLDVVLTAHGNETRMGDDQMILRPDVQGGSYSEIFKLADGVAYLRMSNMDRVLAWDPQDRYVGKNPGQIEPTVLPDFAESPQYLGGLVTVIKERIGLLSAAGSQVRSEVKEWGGKVKSANSAAALTKLVLAVNNALEGAALRQVKVMIMEKAGAKKVVWDKEAGKFVKVKAEDTPDPVGSDPAQAGE